MVKKKRVQKTAFSLVELLVVLTVIAALVALTIPAIKSMQRSFDSTGAEGMISTALSTARTLAIKNNHYAGVRFQKTGDPNNVLKADQYMIFIIFDKANERGWVCGFTAVEGYKPIKLPENTDVIDKIIRRDRKVGDNCGTKIDDANTLVPADLSLSDTNSITDTSTFSIVFSPAGKLVIEKLRCARRNTNDDIFNDLPDRMFIEDKHDDSGIGVENSRREFWIYNREKFEKMTTSTQRMNYLNGPEAKKYYINPYTGELIK
jgi:prepilin-type N-terminal cleavage/methylation domain-containing protein